MTKRAPRKERAFCILYASLRSHWVAHGATTRASETSARNAASRRGSAMRDFREPAKIAKISKIAKGEGDFGVRSLRL